MGCAQTEDGGAVANAFNVIINGLSVGSMYALLALGYSMVYGIIKLINFAHGDIFMLGAYFGHFLLIFFVPFLYFGIGLPMILSFIAASILASMICAVIGVIMERLAYRPLRKAPRIAALITAVGISFFLENFTQQKYVFTASPQPYLVNTLKLQGNINNVPQIFSTNPIQIAGGVTIQSMDIFTILLSLLLMLILMFIIYKTKIGLAMRAVAYDLPTAQLMGVNADQVISNTFLLGSFFAGIAGNMWGLYFANKIDPMMGLLPGIKAFVAAVVGGIGSIPGAAAGGLVLGLAENLVKFYLRSSYADAFAFAALIVILLFRPTGIFGKTAVEKV